MTELFSYITPRVTTFFLFFVFFLFLFLFLFFNCSGCHPRVARKAKASNLFPHISVHSGSLLALSAVEAIASVVGEPVSRSGPAATADDDIFPSESFHKSLAGAGGPGD